MKKPINFEFEGITTEQFALLDENYQDTDDPVFQMGMDYKVNFKEKRLGCFISVIYGIEDRPFLKIETSCTFAIKPESWSTFNNNQKVVFPKGFIEHITAISVSTTRGVLHAKTEGSPFNKFMLPLINVKKVVENDIVFDMPIE